MTVNCDHYHWGQDPDSTGPLGIDYIYLDNCLFPDGHVFIILLMFVWVIVLMNQMATTASDYFSPTLGLVSAKLNLAYDIAGVTFLAFGNGAPDFFALLASVSGGVDILVAFSALLGGEVFISTVVVGTIAIYCPCELSHTIMYRDLAYFLVAVTSVLVIAIIQCVPFWLAAVYIMIYISYVVVVMVLSWFGAGQSPVDSRKVVDALSGDIGLTRFDTESIQTAFWHKDAAGEPPAGAQGTGNAPLASAKKPAMLSKPPERGGYIFLILDDPDDENQTGDGSGARIRPDTINLSGGFEPDFSEIIKEDYCSTVHSHAEENRKALLETGYVVNDDPEDEDTDMEVGSDSNSLEERLLSGGARGGVGHSSGGAVNPLRKAKAAVQIRGSNRTQYEQLLTSLYWQQWAFQRRFHHTSMSSAEWRAYPWWKKIGVVIDYPFTVLRDLTIPTLNNDNWSKFHAMAHPIIDPLFVASLFGFAHDSVGGIPVPIVCLLISIVPTGAIYVLTHHNRAPTGVIFTVTWTLSAFFMCVVWIYVLAGELITCLSALGNIMGIPPAFLGLTVLAWGNSMGDFFTNTSVAQQGFGEMALAGCYGGPVFNILMGLSSALAFASLQTYPNAYPVKLDAACILSIVFLYISLLSTIVIVTLNNFKIDRKFGIYLLSLYAVYSVCQLMLVFL
jgi:sodium/potassium/calcium exchanger 6